MGLRTVFFGTPDFARTVLEGLLASRHEVVGVVAARDRPAGRGRKVRPGPVARLAGERGLTLLQPEGLKGEEALRDLEALGPDVFVVASYGRMLPARILSVPRIMPVNVHPSLLPKLRGAAPIEHAVLGGLSETGVTIIRMNERMDAGDIIARNKVAVGPRETAGSLRERLAGLSAGPLLEALDRIESGEVAFEPQDDSRATFAPEIKPADGAVSWRVSAGEIDRRVRALGPRPGAFARLPDGGRMKLIEVEVVERVGPVEGGRPVNKPGEPGEVLVASGKRGILVACGGGALWLRRLQPEGGKVMDGAAFVRGRRLEPGARLLDGLG